MGGETVESQPVPTVCRLSSLSPARGAGVPEAPSESCELLFLTKQHALLTSESARFVYNWLPSEKLVFTFSVVNLDDEAAALPGTPVPALAT